MTNPLDALFQTPTQPEAPSGSAASAPVPDGEYAAHAAAALQAETEAVRLEPQGSRNDRLNTAAFNLGQLIAVGTLDEHVVIEQLTAAALQAGLTRPETTATLRSGLAGGKQHPRRLPASSTDPFSPSTRRPQPPVDTKPADPLTAAYNAAPGADTGSSGSDGGDGGEPPQVDEDAFWSSRPLLRHLHDFARARRVSPWAVLGATLARIAAATHYTAVLPPAVGTYGSLNLFIALVGPSGSGKGAAESVAAEALDLGWGRFDTHTTGSGEGIAHAYKHRKKSVLDWNQDHHSVLFTVPEIDTLSALGNRQGATLMPELRRAWSGERLGFAYADPTRRIPIEAGQYRLALIAGVQPARAGNLLDDADGGTPQRFLWLPSTDPLAPDVPPDCPKPMQWDAPLLWTSSPKRCILQVVDIATKTIDDARLARLHGDGDALDGHSLYTRLKTAAVLAIAESRTDVTESDWELAGVIMDKSDQVRANVQQILKDADSRAHAARAQAEARRQVVVEEELGEAAVKRVARTVTRKLDRVDTDDGWIGHAKLAKAVAGRDRGWFTEAVGRLADAGQIEVSEQPRGTFYRLPGGTS